MLSRWVHELVKRRLRTYPAVALVGPRQCGKTTLARTLGGEYFDLEQSADRLRVDLQWPTLMERSNLVILDEAQSWPEVFVRLRGAIDEDRQRCGRFLLLGSVAPSLMTQVSESLAGRLSIVELTPFLLGELPTQAARDRLWLCGGFPDGGVLRRERFPVWQHDYLQLLIGRDLPVWGLPARPFVTQRLARMLAAVHGQLWNASQLGKSLGLNYQTINSYLDYLEGAFLIRRLPPFFANIRKRLVKSPKVYWRDTGILHAQLGVEDIKTLLVRPWVGASWEGFVIEQVLGALGAHGARVNPYHLRTSDQHELDLVLEHASALWAIEVKLTTNPKAEDLARLDKTADLIGASKRFLVSQTRRVLEGERTTSCDLPWLLEWLVASAV